MRSAGTTMLAWFLPIAVCVLPVMSGCARQSSTMASNTSLMVSRSGVSPMPGQSVAALDSDTTVGLMRASGFSDAQIVELGPGVRNALASSGGATVRIDKIVEAIYMADTQRIFVTSRLRGAFTYSLVRTP